MIDIKAELARVRQIREATERLTGGLGGLSHEFNMYEAWLKYFAAFPGELPKSTEWRLQHYKERAGL